MFAVNTKENYLLMKKIQLFHWILFLVIAFNFISCDNEPLEGVFVQDEDVITAEEGQFVATIGETAVVAIEASGVLTLGNILIITGTITDTGEIIVFTIENPGLGTFNITAGLGTLNSGLYIDGIDLMNPYTTDAALEGSGELTLTEMDAEMLTLSGTFNFIGARIELDSDGNPIMDDNGNPTIETIEISSGSFNSIPYTIEEAVPTDQFFAKVDDLLFNPDTISVTQSIVAGVSMISVIATIESTGERIRIDFPETIGVGTFDMQSISNGTDIIGSYNENTGAENLTSNPGTLIITEMDGNTGTVVGAFEFTGTDPLGQDPSVVEVTEGSFTLLNLNLSNITNTFSAEIGSEAYNPDDISASQNMINDIPVIIIQAIDTETNQGMTLVFPADISEGTHLMSSEVVVGDEKIGYFTPDIGNSITYSSDPGSLTINTIDPDTGVFEGVFQFIATDPANEDPATFTITNGTFLVVVQ
jgi:hypothetical protein